MSYSKNQNDCEHEEFDDHECCLDCGQRKEPEEKE